MVYYLHASLFAKFITVIGIVVPTGASYAKFANVAASRIRLALSKIIRDKRSLGGVINARPTI